MIQQWAELFVRLNIRIIKNLIFSKSYWKYLLEGWVYFSYWGTDKIEDF